MSKLRKDALGDRMKTNYENTTRYYLTRKSPVIIRIDGRAFHTFTKGFIKPFDGIFTRAMQHTAQYLCKNISGCKLAYVQSDEISLLLTDYDTPETQAWFDNNLQKIVSVAASLATLEFNRQFERLERELNSKYVNYPDIMVKAGGPSAKDIPWCTYLNAITKGATFDARAFVIPKEEICNYFIWRQQDAIRNSIQAVAQAYFSQKQLQGKKCSDLLEMLKTQKNMDWDQLLPTLQRGNCCIKGVQIFDSPDVNKSYSRPSWEIDDEIPVFSQDKNYILSKIQVTGD